MNGLLVDDHRLLAEALAGLIEARVPGSTVTQAATLAEGLARLTEATRRSGCL